MPRSARPTPDSADLQAPELLCGARLRLRRSVMADAPFVHRVASDAEVTRYMVWPRHAALAEAEDFLAGTAAGWASGRDLHWMIETIADDAPIGCMGCRVNGAVADFGYFLAPRAWGKGYATEACAVLIGWLRGRGVARVEATTDHENLRSAAVLERAGLVRERVLRGATLRPNLGGPARDTLVYALALDRL